jgi:Gluconate 2-dehydrogenase subunit 3
MEPMRKAETWGITRRDWLKLVAAGATLAMLGGLAWQFRRVRLRLQPVTDLERAMIARIVDLLVPRDETPGAVDLGVHRRVISELEGNRTLAKLYAEALLDLDRDARAKHGADFLALDTARQESLLQVLSEAPRSMLGGRIFRLLRRDTMRFYYARPEVWPSLGFDGPPQPRGFLDYTDPPRPRA